MNFCSNSICKNPNYVILLILRIYNSEGLYKHIYIKKKKVSSGIL